MMSNADWACAAMLVALCIYIAVGATVVLPYAWLHGGLVKSMYIAMYRDRLRPFDTSQRRRYQVLTGVCVVLWPLFLVALGIVGLVMALTYLLTWALQLTAKLIGFEDPFKDE